MELRIATIGEARACARVVADALHDDPVGACALPGRRDRRARLTSLYEAELRAGAFADGIVEVAERDGSIVGLAAWVRPGARRSVATSLALAPRYLHAVWPVHAGSAIRALRTRLAARPDLPHWLLADVVVVESARGQGIGGALLRSGLERHDDATYLEATTPASRRLYERFGFVAQSEIGIEPGGYPVAMWRAPRIRPAEPLAPVVAA